MLSGVRVVLNVALPINSVIQSLVIWREKVTCAIVWCMKFKKALIKEKNTSINRKDENGLKLKLIITSFNIRLLTLRKRVAS